jgi:hypothetical protein
MQPPVKRRDCYFRPACCPVREETRGKPLWQQCSQQMQLPGHHDAAASIGTRPPLHEDCVEPNESHVLLDLCRQLENAILLKNGGILSGVCQVEVGVLG